MDNEGEQAPFYFEIELGRYARYIYEYQDTYCSCRLLYIQLSLLYPYRIRYNLNPLKSQYLDSRKKYIEYFFLPY